ncbi:hypothetical protein SAMN05877809_101170 [Rhodobacter sp. JA431]|uniref:hypothetical protein n=1 Tax=Rhodobacter sp. JA431 TaxID=570013 RepID=UPI000BCB8FF6|nr:hypothetical protein [Rhodobacter sp. JA431]SOB90335.1 hypothetical protein SAMN05877809_101170 [Rhodobacter sp. JA431]
MSELDQKQLEALEVERAKIFTPGWFGDLISGRLSFGDTFWLGLFGVLMFVVPAVVLVAGLLYAQATAAMIPFLKVISGLYGIWALAVSQALLRIGARGGWPITGMALAAGMALYALYTAATL